MAPTFTTVDLSAGPFTIPAGVASGDLYAAGAGVTFIGGFGAWLKGTLAVTPGQVIASVVGKTTSTQTAGVPDGKPGYNNFTTGGGGSTKITVDGTTRLIGPGGGGMGYTGSNNAGGGDGGYPNGANGLGSSPGSGATQSADGSGALGSLGGGGGGGFHKGGSGTNSGGGGGSGYADALLTSVTTGRATQGDGSATFTYRNPVTPSIPTILTPAAGSGQPTGAVPLRWQYNADDIQAGASVDYRPVAGSTTTGTITDATNQYTPTLTNGDWEWRVKTTSGDGLDSLYSAWTMFHVETVPASPVITAPANLSTVTDVTLPIAWTGTATSWQAQILNGSTVLWDSGTVLGTATSVTGMAPVNSITATVRVRLKAVYVWSDWVTVTITVAWVGPLAPEPFATSDPANGCIRIGWVQPAGSPAVDHYRIEVTEDGVRSGVQGLATVDPATREATFWTPRSGIPTALHVIAYAASGAYTDSTTGWSN